MSSDPNHVILCSKAWLNIDAVNIGTASVRAWNQLKRWHGNREFPRQQDRLVQFLRLVHGQEFGFELGQPGQDQKTAITQWRLELARRYPAEIKTVLETGTESNANRTLGLANWNSGDARRGKSAYRKYQCANCHDGNSRLGPDLAGITKRFNRSDLFDAILYPNRQVAQRYRATIVESVDGMVYRGAMIYDSIDGMNSTGHIGRNHSNQSRKYREQETFVRICDASRTARPSHPRRTCRLVCLPEKPMTRHKPFMVHQSC